MAREILITGGTGFIGKALCRQLLERGDRLTVLSRQPAETVRTLCGQVTAVNSLDLLRGHPGFEAVINLAGEGIADKRWSQARKRQLRDSRIELTRQLGECISGWKHPPRVLVSGSAVGYYGDQGAARVTEQTHPHDEFTHQLCRDWEQAAQAMAPSGTRVCISRTGLVIGRNGGFLARMLPLFRLGLGGRLGSGEQYMPWVHLQDVISALLWMLDQESASGPYNVVSPAPVTNRAFTRTLGRLLQRPTLCPVPAWLLSAGLGEMSRLLLTGQKAIPERLQQEGFRFRFPDLQTALQDVLEQKHQQPPE